VQAERAGDEVSNPTTSPSTQGTAVVIEAGRIFPKLNGELLRHCPGSRETSSFGGCMSLSCCASLTYCTPDPQPTHCERAKTRLSPMSPRTHSRIPWRNVTKFLRHNEGILTARPVRRIVGWTERGPAELERPPPETQCWIHFKGFFRIRNAVVTKPLLLTSHSILRADFSAWRETAKLRINCPQGAACV
jgi:hypothetical protein